MRETIITVEVNRAWVTEQADAGKEPFAELSGVLKEKLPDVRVESRENCLIVRSNTPTDSGVIRSCVRSFFSEKHHMTPEEGDLSISTTVRRIEEEYAERRDKEAAEEQDKEPAKEQEKERTQGRAEASGEKESARGEKAAAQTAEAKEEPADSPEPFIRMPAVDAFLAEFETVIKSAKRLRMESAIWRTNLLLAMDDGYGITTTLNRIADLMEKNGFRFTGKTSPRILEYRIPDRQQDQEQVFDQIAEKTKSLYTEEEKRGHRSETAPVIICLDISTLLGSSRERFLHEQLNRLTGTKASFLYVFRVPFLEETALRAVQQTLSDLLVIRRISVEQLPNDVFAAFLVNHLRKSGFTIPDEEEENFEKLILMEKRDGRFHGLRTMERLAADITYHKLAEGNDDTAIREADLSSYYSFMTEEDEEDPMEALEAMCGMENVREKIDEIVAQIQSYREQKKQGRKLTAPAMHMRFVGNPGTGKTSVARLVARIFRNKGILKKGFFFEIKARDLCGRYVGETAPKTSRFCRDALGSILFIDEAYSLYRGDSRVDYGIEAIETLITEMEMNRDNLIVIMAGYEEEMKELLESNSGLASRIPYEIRFRNYSREELKEIFFSMIPDGFSYSDEFDRAIRSYIDSIPEDALNSRQFGNGRTIRNLYERVWAKAAFRLQAEEGKVISFSEEDVQAAIADTEFRQMYMNTKSRIGF
ncbi:MAG: AAA family ATPase [Lachnospiraceae bacterium]|nr:AAA family ATPase [Lachnospiraceae bacterium]